MMFSIIVPIYNVEKYLPECIESVQHQNFDSYELILVDDGSPDRCPEICEKYAEKDEHIVVIHKKNGGLSAARNTGIKIAKGDYIIFLDGDDALNESALERLCTEFSLNEKVDILIGNVHHWFKNEEIVYFNNNQFTDYAKDHSLSDLCEMYAKRSVLIPWRAWQSAYRLDFIKEHHLLFDSNIIGAEDCDFFFKLLPFVESYILSDFAIVKYRAFREGSVVNAPSYKSIMGQLVVFKKLFDSTKLFTDEKLMKRYFSDKFTNIIILVNGLKNNNEKKICLDYIIKNKYIISHCTKVPKYIVAKAIWSILGFERGNALLIKLKSKL